MALSPCIFGFPADNCNLEARASGNHQGWFRPLLSEGFRGRKEKGSSPPHSQAKSLFHSLSLSPLSCHSRRGEEQPALTCDPHVRSVRGLSYERRPKKDSLPLLRDLEDSFTAFLVEHSCFGSFSPNLLFYIFFPSKLTVVKLAPLLPILQHSKREVKCYRYRHCSSVYKPLATCVSSFSFTSCLSYYVSCLCYSRLH